MQSKKIRPEVRKVSPQRKLELTVKGGAGGEGRRCEVVWLADRVVWVNG